MQINQLIYINKIEMVTQRTTLNKELKTLEKNLHFAVLNNDPFTEAAIYKRIEIVKSTLLNLD